MPMDFPDMKSLKNAAEVWKFREPKEDETEFLYRAALADFVSTKDIIESEEIRNGCGWDVWTHEQKKAMITRVTNKR